MSSSGSCRGSIEVESADPEKLRRRCRRGGPAPARRANVGRTQQPPNPPASCAPALQRTNRAPKLFGSARQLLNTSLQTHHHHHHELPSSCKRSPSTLSTPPPRVTPDTPFTCTLSSSFPDICRKIGTFSLTITKPPPSWPRTGTGKAPPVARFVIFVLSPCEKRNTLV